LLGLGPLSRSCQGDIADIMVNGADKVYIETNGKIELTTSGSATTAAR